MLLSGFLGATASCIAKIVFSSAIRQHENGSSAVPEPEAVVLDNDSGDDGGGNAKKYFDNFVEYINNFEGGLFTEITPAQYLYESCQHQVLKSGKDDFDSILLNGVYYIIGQLLVKCRLVVLPYWKAVESGIEHVGITFNIFEIDWCHASLLLPRIIGFILVLIVNALMVAYFIKGIQASGSVAGPALSSATNFISSAIYGYVLWGELFNPTWWIGFTLVLLGVMILSTVSAATTTGTTTRTKSKSETRRLYGGARSPAPPKVPPPPSTPPIPGTAYVSSMTNRFNNSNVSNTKPSTTTTPLASSSTPSSNSKGFFSSFSTSTKTPEIVTTSTATINKEVIKKNIKVKNFNAIIPKPKGLIDVTFVNICALCEEELFEKDTGVAPVAVADLSPACYHIFHSTCLKLQQQAVSGEGSSPSSSTSGGGGSGRRRSSGTPKGRNKVGCPVCDKVISMWISAKQSAHFAGFWMERVEKYLRKVGPLIIEGDDPKKSGPQPVPASMIRDYLRENDTTLTEEQKRYIDDDPTGLGKGLQSALEWGGYVDFNEKNSRKGHVGWSSYKRSCGIWSYSTKHDDIWYYEWDTIHPRQRCESCQFLKRPLPIVCDGCVGSSECAYYCSPQCQKRDWQRHKLMCETWQNSVPLEARNYGTKR